jgi:hypothetical protein
VLDSYTKINEDDGINMLNFTRHKTSTVKILIIQFFIIKYEKKIVYIIYIYKLMSDLEQPSTPLEAPSGLSRWWKLFIGFMVVVVVLLVILLPLYFTGNLNKDKNKDENKYNPPPPPPDPNSPPPPPIPIRTTGKPF